MRFRSHFRSKHCFKTITLMFLFIVLGVLWQNSYFINAYASSFNFSFSDFDGKIIDLSSISGNFQDEINNLLQSFSFNQIHKIENAEIVFYYSDFCPHCRKVLDSKVLDKISEFVSVERLIADQDFVKICTKFNVYPAVPTLFLIVKQNEKETYQVFSLQGDDPIINFLNHLYDKIKSNWNPNSEVNSSVTNTNISTNVNANASSQQEKKNFLQLLFFVSATALADSVNPCIISVLILIITYLLQLKRKRDVIKYGSLFTILVYLTYLFIGLFIFFGLNFLEHIFALNRFSKFFGLTVALVCIFAGLVNIKDYFAYGKGISFGLSKKQKRFVQILLRRLSLSVLFVLAFFVTIVEFPCSGIMYLGLVIYLKNVMELEFIKVLLWLLWYNLLFVLPLIIIVLSVYFGYDIGSLEHKRLKYRKWMRLIMGIVLVILGIVLIKSLF